MRRPPALPGSSSSGAGEAASGTDAGVSKAEPPVLASDSAEVLSDQFDSVQLEDEVGLVVAAEGQSVATDDAVHSDLLDDSDEVRASQDRLREAKAAKRALKAASRARHRAERREASRFTVALRRRRLSFWLGFTGFVLVVSFALFFAYGPVFTVRSVEVNGVSDEQSAQIVASLESQQGRPLALVDEAEIEAALAQFPFIASFDVQVHPPESLVINLVPRIAVGYLEDDAGTFQLVDGAGVVLSTGDVPPLGYASLGQISLNSEEFTAAASVVLSLPAELREQITRVSANTANDVMFYLGDDNTRVMWGSADDSALKLIVLDALMNAQPSPGRIYDVSSPEAAVIRG